MSCTEVNTGFAPVVAPTPTSDPTFSSTICGDITKYYFTLLIVGPNIDSCAAGAAPWVHLEPDPGIDPNNVKINPTKQYLKGFPVGLTGTALFYFRQQAPGANQYDLFTSTGIKVDSAEYHGSPARNILGNGLSNRVVEYFSLPFTDTDGNFDFNGQFNLLCKYTNDGANTKPYGNLVSGYCEDGGKYELCMQSNTPTSGRVVTFTGRIVANMYQMPFNITNYRDTCMAFLCNSDCSKVDETYGGKSFNAICNNYLSSLMATSTDPSRISVDKFLTNNGVLGQANKCLIPTQENLFGLMSQECQTFCKGTNDRAQSCLSVRQTFCQNIMPISGSVEENFSTLCACFWPVAFYSARTQQTVDAISKLYPGLRSLLTTLFTDNVSPQCNYGPCNANNNYILASMTTANCRPVNLCLQSINANIGTATNSDINIANSCVINDVNNGSSGASLTPDQQAALKAYNSGTANQAPKTGFLTTLRKSFTTLGWIFLAILGFVLLVILLVIIFVSLKKVVPPPNVVKPNFQTQQPVRPVAQPPKMAPKVPISRPPPVRR